MLWMQFAAVAMLVIVLVALTVVRPSRAQHAGSGIGSYGAWQLIAAVEAERGRSERGRAARAVSTETFDPGPAR